MTVINNPNFDKELYWQRREKKLRGQMGYSNVGQSVLTDKGPQFIPQGFKPVKVRRDQKR